MSDDICTREKLKKEFPKLEAKIEGLYKKIPSRGTAEIPLKKGSLSKEIAKFLKRYSGVERNKEREGEPKYHFRMVRGDQSKGESDYLIVGEGTQAVNRPIGTKTVRLVA